MSQAERRGQLSRECEFVIRSYVFARFLTRPPDNLGMPLTLTPQSRDRFAPMNGAVLWQSEYNVDGWKSKQAVEFSQRHGGRRAAARAG